MLEQRQMLAAIERSQAVIEFDLTGKVLRANAKYLSVMHYTAEEIESRHHRMFVLPAYADSQDYAQLWQALNAGEYISGKFLRLGKGGREVWIEATYNPIFDETEKPYKVIKFATDVTAAVLQAADHAGQIAAISKSQAVVSFQLDGTILGANANFLSLLEYSEKEVVGRHHSMFVKKGFEATAEYKHFWEKLQRGEYFTGEFKRITKSGREVWIQATYNPIFDPVGRLIKVVKFASDVTEAKVVSADHAGQLLAINRSQAVISYDTHGTILSANPNFLSIMGYTEDQVIGRHHSIFVDSVYAAGDEYAKFWETLRSGNYHSGEFRRLKSDGTEIWLQASYNPIFDTNGDLAKIVKYASDITKEVKQREKFTLLSLVADITVNAVLIADQTRKVVYVNRGFTDMNGFREDEVIGRNLRDVLQGAHTDKATDRAITAALADEKSFVCEILNYTKDGNPYWTNLSINPVKGPSGRAERFISVQGDVTAIKKQTLDFLTKMQAISASNAMAEWTVQGTPVQSNAIIDNAKAYQPALSQIISETDLNSVLRDGHLRREVAVPRAEQEPLWLDAVFSVLVNIEGQPERILMCGSDITSRRKVITQSVESMTGMLESITQIVGSINDFARQTNLLALNAAVEAARAQESGKGFALIAQEIRNLAASAAGATDQIERLLHDGRGRVSTMSQMSAMSHSHVA